MELVSTKVVQKYDQSLPSLHHHVSQFKLRKRNNTAGNQMLSQQSFESSLYSLKDVSWNRNITLQERPVIRLSCKGCCPRSHKSLLVSKTLPIIDVLKIDSYDKNAYKGIFSFFYVIKHCLSFKKYDFPYVYHSVLAEEKLRDVIIQSGHEDAEQHGISDEEGINYFIEKQRKRAVLILKKMHSCISDTLLRLTAWVFYKALPYLFSSMSIPKGQIEMLKTASASGVPLIFLPLHRSHIDYLAVTFILCNNGIRSPLVAAGENLRIPFFGGFIRRLGAFFIKRRIEPTTKKKDKVYRAILHSYMTHSLRAGHFFEFFIEGGRSRTGKPCMPKGGLMSVFVDAYLSGILENAILVPVSINYDKIVEGSFISELTGEPKKPETFTSAVYGIWKAFTSQYGLVRVDFNQPFSLQELVESFQKKKLINNGGSFHMAPSTSSLYGTDVVNEDQRQLVDSITRHILYDCSQSTAVMSTNALSFLLLYCYRSGTTLSKLTIALDQLRSELARAKKDTGFTGDSKDVLQHAAKLMGSELVQIEKTKNDFIYKPVTLLPNVLELMYYSNTLTLHFCIEGVVGRTLLCLTAEQENSKVTLDRIFEVSILLCEILQFEFIFTKSCQVLNNVIFECLESMVTNDLVSKFEISGNVKRSGYVRTLELLNDEDDDEDFTPPSPLYQVCRKHEKLELYGRMLEPLIDVYSLVTSHLPKIVGQVLPQHSLLNQFLAIIKEHIQAGTIKYAESLNFETVKNCMKVLEKWNVLECHIEDSVKLYYLNSDYDDPEALGPIINKVDQFRHTHRH